MRKKRLQITLIIAVFSLLLTIIPKTVDGFANANADFDVGSRIGNITVERVTSTMIQQLDMNWSGCELSNSLYTFTNPEQPNIVNRCNNVFKIGEQSYDMVFHYKAMDWGNTKQIFHYEDGWVWGGSKPNRAAMRIYEGTTSKTVPSVEWSNNGTVQDSTSGWFMPDVTVDIDIYKHGTTEHLSGIKEIAFAVSDMDHSNDGFYYSGDDISHIYVNGSYERGILKAGYSGGKYYFSDTGPTSFTDLCGFDGEAECAGETHSWGDNAITTNPGTIILQSDSIKNGHFTVSSYFYNKGATHIEFSGIVFIGSKVKVRYFCDNGDHNLSSYNETFVGSGGERVPYDNKSEVLQSLFDKGYELVSDAYGESKNFPDSGEVTYDIHLKHGIEDVNLETNAKRTIRYWFNEVNGETASTPVVQTTDKFTKTYKKDKVTGVVTGNPNWVPESRTVPEVVSPKEDATYNLDRTWFYDKPKIDVETLYPNDDVVRDVIYYRDRLRLVDCEGNELVGKFEIIDKSTNKVIDTINTSTDFKPISNLVYGKDYIIRQVETVEPYILSEDVEFTADSSKDITIINVKISVKKLGDKDTSSQEILEGASFVVKDRQGKVVYEFTTKTELIEIPGLKEGETYTIEEVNAPDSYVISHPEKFVVEHVSEKCAIHKEYWTDWTN